MLCRGNQGCFHVWRHANTDNFCFGDSHELLLCEKR